VEKQATVRDLLEARSGVYHPTAYETKGMLEEKPPRGSHAPGTFWYYNNWDFNTLGYIYEQATGTKIFDAFYREIGQPIGMQDFRARDGHYISSEDSRFPAYPFEMSARDFARFALLYLHGGRWNSTQVVPEEWVKGEHATVFRYGVGWLWVFVVDGRRGQWKTARNNFSERKLLGRRPSWAVCRGGAVARSDYRQPSGREGDQTYGSQTTDIAHGATGGGCRAGKLRGSA
jgi:CubicO group peptidase (beta-lactamase class C family)